MKVYDISMGISQDMPVYKGRASKKPIFKLDSDFTTGTVYETRLDINLHSGTHMDAPLHAIDGGSTVDKLDLTRVITKCKVFDFTAANEKISGKHLSSKNIADGDFILLKTQNSYADILENEFIYLDKSGAEYLCSKNIIGVGIDSLGIERNQPGHETHKTLLSSGIVILEGLRLADIEEGEYYLIAPPIKIIGAEGAPVRALLLKTD